MVTQLAKKFTFPLLWNPKVHYSGRKTPPISRFSVTYRTKLVSLRRGVVSPSLNTQAGVSPLVGCPQVLIQYSPSYLPSETPQTRQALVTGTHIQC